MEVFNFIIEETSLESVLNFIEQIPEDEQLNWEFSSLTPVIKALNSPNKEQIEAIVRYFEKHHDKVKLTSELDKIDHH